MVLICFIDAIAAFVAFRIYLRTAYHLRDRIQDAQECVNVIIDERRTEAKRHRSLQEKIQRYDSFKRIIEEINRSIELDALAQHLCEITFRVVGQGKGTCILYLFDQQANALGVLKTRKEHRNQVIKAKEGDSFDTWVLHHSSPLLVEDIRNDFRFDPEKLPQLEQRTVGSLVSAPLISEHTTLGILRLDDEEKNAYTQDDLRLLVSIADLGAVAIENSLLYQKTKELATHDSLTGLFTKGYFLERLRQECKRSNRQERALSLLMCDIDFFKHYNDTFGHTAGDLVLKSISQNISQAVEKYSPVVCRFGGEEFCVILPELDKKEALTVAETLRLTIESAPMILRRQERTVTVSIGVASFPNDAGDEEELLIKADRAMYEAKQKGRNRVCAI